MAEKKKDSPAKPEPQKLKLKYEETSAQYANQFLVNTTAEELFLDLSSGAVTDPSTGESIIPIHTRIAMSYNGAQRLAQILAQAVQRHENAMSGKAPPASKAAARLPKIDS
ncbi:MAG: DUF3467 domain-containing protein [Verrucomicrobiota bacterium]